MLHPKLCFVVVAKECMCKQLFGTASSPHVTVLSSVTEVVM